VGVGAGGEMTQALYAHMNNKPIKKKLRNNKKKRTKGFLKFIFLFFFFKFVGLEFEHRYTTA
jgi:hypothetical protein